MTDQSTYDDPPPNSVFFAAALVLCLLGKGCGDIAHAQPPAAVEPHPAVPMTLPAELTLPDVRVALQPRQLAPFEGILFDPGTLVRWTQRIEWLENRLHLEHELHVQLEDASRQSYQTLTTQLTESYEREISADREILSDTQAALERAQQRIAELERRPPHRAFAIGMGLGAGLTLGAGVLGAVLAH